MIRWLAFLRLQGALGDLRDETLEIRKT